MLKEKKWAPLWIAALIILILELTFGNFSTWKSLFLHPVVLQENQTVTEGTVITIESLDLTIHNLGFSLSLPKDQTLSYELSLTDEGNKYSYTLPQRTICGGVSSTQFANLYPYGRVHSLSITFHTTSAVPVAIDSIYANCVRPFHFNLIRFLLLYSVFLFFYLLKDKHPAVVLWNPDSKAQQRITLLAAILLMLAGLLLTSSQKYFVESSKPHHEQYKELAVALREGHFYVDDQPSEGLLQAENPYDTIALQAEGIPYRMDYAYYEGKYYVYFGLVPELLLYFPVYLVTGKLLPNHIAVFLFYCGFVCGTFLLLREICKRLFEKIPFYIYLLSALSILFCGSYTYLLGRADLYHVPLMSALCFTVLGLWFWLKASCREGKAPLFLGAGSLCMALVAGCRPQMLVFSLLAIPIFYKTIQKRKFHISFFLPYLVVATGLMYYNAARFGSVFDFGATYSLTNNDMNLRGFNLQRIFYGLFCFLFQPISLTGSFPFLQSVTIESSYLGKLVTEYFFGGIFFTHPLTLVTFLLPLFYRQLREKHLWLPLITAVAGSLMIGLVDAGNAGILQRYCTDMSFGLILSTAVLLLFLADYFNGSALERHYSFALKLAFLLQLCYAIMVLFQTSGGLTWENYNPSLYYEAMNLFNI